MKPDISRATKSGHFNLLPTPQSQPRARLILLQFGPLQLQVAQVDQREGVIRRGVRMEEEYPRHAREDRRVMSLVGRWKAV